MKRVLLLALALALSVGQARAITYNVHGTATLIVGNLGSVPEGGFDGQFDVNLNTGSVIAATFTGFQGPWTLAGTGPADINSGAFFLRASVPNVGIPTFSVMAITYLTGFTGSPFSFSGSAFEPDCVAPCHLDWAAGNFAVVTPLPAALPLFATGLGALGLLVCRKRKALAD